MTCEGSRVGLLGLTHASPAWSAIYVRPYESTGLLHIVLLHEAGNAWDFARLSPRGGIDDWCAARGCNAAHFYVGGQVIGGANEAPGAEDFAASWNACHGGTYDRSYLGLPAPSAAQCALQNQLTGFPR